MNNKTFRTLTLAISFASLIVAYLSYRAATQRRNGNDLESLLPDGPVTLV